MSEAPKTHESCFNLLCCCIYHTLHSTRLKFQLFRFLRGWISWPCGKKAFLSRSVLKNVLCKMEGLTNSWHLIIFNRLPFWIKNGLVVAQIICKTQTRTYVSITYCNCTFLLKNLVFEVYPWDLQSRIINQTYAVIRF